MGEVDALDVGVLRALFQGQGLAPVNARARTCVRAVAAQLGVSEGTVRNRILRLHESGFIKEVRLIPNPSLMGLGEANVLVDVPREKLRDEFVEELRLLGDVVILAVFHGPLVSVIFRYRGEPELVRRIALIRRLAKVDAVTVGRIPFPPCNLPLSSSDWGLLRAFHRDPGRTYASVGREVHASSRTVKRKLERMLRENAAFVFPAFDIGKIPRGTVGTLIVEYPLEIKADVDRRVTARLGESFFTILHMLPFRNSDPALCGYNFVVPNVPKGQAMLHELQAIRGIQAARVEWFERVEMNFEPFAEDLQRGQATMSLSVSG